MTPDGNDAGLLAHQVAFVTGGADGIGLEIARRFAQEGARVMIGDVREEVAADAAAHARAEGLDLRSTLLDVADEDSVERALDVLTDQLGDVTTVVANAGILRLAPATELDVAQFRRVLDVNLTGAFLTGRAGARRMLSAGIAGSITFTSSVAGLRGLRDNAAYSASKFGVVGLAQCLAAELAPAGIRVNTICPGQVDTSMFQNVTRQRNIATETLVARIPMGRLASVDEVADSFVWLASPMARYVTGQAIAVDGGWMLD